MLGVYETTIQMVAHGRMYYGFIFYRELSFKKHRSGLVSQSCTIKCICSWTISYKANFPQRFYSPTFQDVEIIHYTGDQYNKNKVLAGSRRTLIQQGIMGLHQAPCLKALLHKLPLILQDQFLYEKVNEFKIGI